MALTFPAGLLDDAEETLSLLGTFWQQLYQGRTTAWSLCRGKNELERQTYQEVLDASAALGRNTCPVFNTILWHPLVLRYGESQPGNPLLYGDEGALYGDSTLTYGGGTDTSVAWTLEGVGAADLRDCLVIADGMASPSAIFTAGVDFFLNTTRGVIIFREDPFQNPLIAQDLADDGVATVTLWAFRGGYEHNTVQDQYGYAIGLEADSSANYRELVDAILDGAASGPCLASFQRAFGAMADSPFADGNETVEDVTGDANGVLVITDSRVYRYPATANVLVLSGDSLLPGQAIVDTVRIDMPNGTVPAGLTSLTVPAAFFAGVTAGNLTFTNTNETLTITTGVSGKTKLTWPMSDAASDVTAFFNAFHAKGVAAGRTLANLLDRRPLASQTTEPTADNLAPTINPLQVLFQNVFRGNLILARVKVDRMGPNALGLGYEWALRRLLPPGTALLVVSEED
jgi:hypothetical protein